jgi:hypothetical protein
MLLATRHMKPYAYMMPAGRGRKIQPKQTSFKQTLEQVLAFQGKHLMELKACLFWCMLHAKGM